jgi:hypothetical protein
MKEQYPAISKFRIDYNGSGDSFSDFYDGRITWNDDKIHDASEESQIEDLIMEKFDDVIWEVIENVGANFNNDGSRGTIYFDFDKLAIGGDVYYYEKLKNMEEAQSFVGELEIDDEESE